MKGAVALAATLETALNRYLSLDPDIAAQLATLEGKVIRLEILGLAMAFYLLPGHDGIQVLSHYTGEADTCLRAAPLTLARLSVGQHAEDRVFSGDVEISGDIELGERFRDILAGADIDWEEQLAHVIGDVAAHQIGNAVRSGLHWSHRTLETFGQDLAEYLQYERRDLPVRHEIETFLSAVDILRADSDRLAARVQRLETVLAKNTVKKDEA